VVEEPRARRGRRFGRRRVSEPEPVIAGGDDVAESLVAQEPVVEELVLEAVVEESVAEAGVEPVVDSVVEGVAEAAAVDEPVLEASVIDEPVVDEQAVDEVAAVVEEPRVRRGRRFGRRPAPLPEPVIATIDEAVETVAEEAVVDELVVDSVVEEPAVGAVSEV